MQGENQFQATTKEETKQGEKANEKRNLVKIIII
jgi:hypothetical protein